MIKHNRSLILNAKELRISHLADSLKQKAIKRVARNEIYIVLDNVLDTYNTGSIFRLADALACKKIYLCGGSETPPNPRIKKASINTTEWVEWEYVETAVGAIGKLRKLLANRSKNNLSRPSRDYRSDEVRTNLQVIAIEQSSKSIQYDRFEYKMPICLVVGHESDGVSKEVLKMCDGIVEIPMFGVNKSLNVMVSLGIVLYEVVKYIKK